MDFKKYLDIKTIFILILAAALILSFIFRPSKKIDNHKAEKELLEKQNNISPFVKYNKNARRWYIISKNVGVWNGKNIELVEIIKLYC